MQNLYPLQFEPVLKDYIWGGRHLEEFGREFPESGPVAESWEISSHEDGMTKVRNGPFAGKTLQYVMDVLGVDLVGSNNQWALDRNKFPLLVKLLDANKKLSVQVHPDDDYARAHEGNELGKTEMWVVLRADRDAVIVYGMEKRTTPEELRNALAKGGLKEFLHQVPIKAGEYVCVPAGTLHTILGGVVIAEIQQNSNTTYRVYDWDRLGTDKQPRPLHIDKALDVINYQQVRPNLPTPEIIEDNAQWRWERLCDNRYFTTERIISKENSQYFGECDGSTLEIWGVIAGRAVIDDVLLNAVEFSLLPAALGSFEIRLFSDSVLLRTFVR
jgi:mannose-6-phosphate isomerase